MNRRDELHELLLEQACNAIQRVSAAILVFDRRKKGRRCDRCAKMGFHTMVWVDPGKKGQGDVYVMFPGGVHGELEVKTGTGRLEPEQINWRLACETRRIPYLLLEAKDRTEMAAQVARAAAWASRLLNEAKNDRATNAATGGGKEEASEEIPQDGGAGPQPNQRRRGKRLVVPGGLG